MGVMNLLKIIGIISRNKNNSFLQMETGLKYTVEDLIYTEDGVKVAYIRLKNGYKMPYEIDPMLVRLLNLQVMLMNMPYNYSGYDKDWLAVESLLQDYVECRDSFVGLSQKDIDERTNAFANGISQIELELNSRLIKNYHLYSQMGMKMKGVR